MQNYWTSVINRFDSLFWSSRKSACQSVCHFSSFLLTRGCRRMTLSLSVIWSGLNCLPASEKFYFAHLLTIWIIALHLTGLRRYATARSGLIVWYNVKLYHVNMYIHFQRFSGSRKWPNECFNILLIFDNVLYI